MIKYVFMILLYCIFIPVYIITVILYSLCELSFTGGIKRTNNVLELIFGKNDRRWWYIMTEFHVRELFYPTITGDWMHCLQSTRINSQGQLIQAQEFQGKGRTLLTVHQMYEPIVPFVKEILDILDSEDTDEDRVVKMMNIFILYLPEYYEEDDIRKDVRNILEDWRI